MPTSTATPYARDFYEAQEPGSLRSARAILPAVIDAVSPASVLDVGCGTGTWLAAVRELGIGDVVGVDGEYVDRERLSIPEELFLAFDLEQRLELGRRFDLVMTLEVAEHLSPQSADAFVGSLTRHGDVVLFSAAQPEQGGTDHVNEQWPAYWAKLFAAQGFVATDPFRSRFWLDPAVEPWYSQNVLAFVRAERLGDFPVLASAVVPGGVPLPLVHPELQAMALRRAGAPNPRSIGTRAAAPAPVPAAAPVTPPAPAGPDLRSFVAVMYVDEVAEDPSLLVTYSRSFSIADDATLVLYAPLGDPERVGEALSEALVAAAMDEDRAPHATLVLDPADEADALLSERAVVVLSRRARRTGLAGVTHAGPEAALLLRAVAAGGVRPFTHGGLGTALLGNVILAACAPDLEDNVDHLRYANGQSAPAPEEWTGLLRTQLGAAEALEPLWDVLDDASRDVLVALLAYKVLGNRKVRMPVGPYSTLRRSAEEIQKRMLVQAETDDPAFLGWILGLYDLKSLGLPIKLHSHPRLLINEFMLEQYRAPEPLDISVRPGDVVIDGGGCWGESALHFAHLSGPEGRVETFEFEPGNLERLRRNLELNPKLAARIGVNERALWHTADEHMSFRADGPATRLDGASEDGALTGSIDALVGSGKIDRVDFIKLDIEGSELSALEGAADTLRRFRPRLAIAAYHREDDLLMLPGFLASLELGYRFAIGHFTMSNEETVLFAWCD